MRIELPVCKRCCFCLPLRYGLVVWGYLKVIMDLILLINFFIDISRTFELPDRITTFFLIFTSTATILVIVDLILSSVFIVGCHQKNVKKIRTFYFYSQFEVALTAVLGVAYFIWVTNQFLEYYTYSAMPLRVCMIEIMNSSIFLVEICLQIYVLLLVRSEIIKLKDGCQFNFVNNAAEAEYTLNMVVCWRERDDKLINSLRK